MAKSNYQTKGFSIVEVLLVLVIVGVLGFIGWFIWHARQTTNASKSNAGSTYNSKQSDSTKSESTSAQVITEVEQQLATKYDLKNAAGAPTGADQLNYQIDSTSPFWRSDGAVYYVRVATGHALHTIHNEDMTTDTMNFEKVQSVYKAVLADKGLKAVTGSPSNEYEIFYVGSGAVCSIEGLSSISNPTNILCAQLKDYAPQSERLKKFADVYPYAEGTGFDVPTIKDSKTPGYQIAVINTGAPGRGGGAVSMFYSKNGTWQFFKITQQGVDCDAYNTQDLRLAFAGEDCLSGESRTVSKVQ